MDVKKIMHNIESIPHNMNVASASVIMDIKNVGELVVEKNGEFQGILTETDILRKVVARCKDPSTTKAHEVLTSNVMMVHEDQTIEDAAALMLNNNVRRLIVHKDNLPIGLITTRIISNNIKLLLNKKLQECLQEKST
jgi:predicted transcriptional regulator